jgi:hypothetical protein
LSTRAIEDVRAPDPFFRITEQDLRGLADGTISFTNYGDTFFLERRYELRVHSSDANGPSRQSERF